METRKWTSSPDVYHDCKETDPSSTEGFKSAVQEASRFHFVACNLCDYKSNRRSNVMRHRDAMHGNAKKIAECCGENFSNKAQLRDHIQACHNNGYKCPICLRLFKRKALLKRHMCVHGGIKDFRCDLCDYATSHKSNLERHIARVHASDTKSRSSMVKVNKVKKLKSGSNEKKKLRLIAPKLQQISTSSSGSDSDYFTGSSTQEIVSPREIGSEDEQKYSSVHSLTENAIDLKFERKSSEPESRLRLCAKPYKCFECEMSFTSQLEYANHQLAHHEAFETNKQRFNQNDVDAAIVLTTMRTSFTESRFLH